MSDDVYGERQLEILRSVFGERSPQVKARLRKALAAAQDAEDWGAVHGLARELLSLSAADAGDEAALQALRGLGQALLQRGDAEAARVHLARAEALAVSLGVAAVELAGDRLRLARALRADGQPARARARAEEALSALLQQPERVHAQGEARLLLVLLAAEDGDGQGALEHLEQARTVDPHAVAAWAPQLHEALDGVARLLAQADRPEQGLACAHAALELADPAGGTAEDRQDRRARDLTLVGSLLRRCGQLAEASQAWEDALTVQTARHGDDSPFVGVLLNNLGALRWDLGDEEAGYELARRANRILSQSLGVAHPHTQASGQALIRMRDHLQQRQVDAENAGRHTR